MTVAKQKRSGSGFVWGLLIGVAVGAAVVWVLTPQPGEIEVTRATGSTSGESSTNGTTSANGVDSTTIMDLAMAAVDRVRARFGDAVALGREAYEQGQTEVLQRFNQARNAE